MWKVDECSPTLYFCLPFHLPSLINKALVSTGWCDIVNLCVNRLTFMNLRVNLLALTKEGLVRTGGAMKVSQGRKLCPHFRFLSINFGNLGKSDGEEEGW